MADFEDESSANLAPVNGLQDNAAGPQDPSLGTESSQFSKQYDPFSAPPASMMDEHGFDSMGYQYQGDTDYPPANEPVPRDFGAFQDDHDSDLPANFAKEAARSQDDFGDEEEKFAEQDHPDMTPSAGGRGDEAEEAIPQGQGSNPFGVGAGDQGMDVAPGSGSGSYVDSNDRPIMGYNPFLNEENREDAEQQRLGEEVEEDEEEVGEGRFDHSQEEGDFFKQQQQQQSFAGVPGDFGRPEHDEERQAHHYDRLEEDDDDEDDADLQMEPVENIQQPPDFGMAAEKEEIAESRPAAEDDRLVTQMEDDSQLPPSFTDNEQTHPEDTCPAQEPDESSLGFDSQPGGFDSQPTEPDFGPRDEIVDQTSDYQPPQSQDTVPSDDIDFEKAGGFEEEQREEESVQVEAKRGGEEEELGIVNQAFSDDVDMEVGKGIQEEEKEEKFEEQQVPATEVEPKVEEEERRDEYMEEEKVQEVQGEKPSELEETEIKQAEDEGEDRGEIAGEQEKQVEMNEEERFSAPADEPAEVTQPEQIDSTKGDYSQEQMRSDEDEEETTEKYSEEIESEKDLGSRLPESDMFSSEQEDRSFVDNLSELTSPVIPQRLPSPPEPKDMSPFDPLAPANSNSISPCHEPEGNNVGQQPGEIFEQEVAADEANTGDFLTAGEVEGETKFGVDGTAITQTATQNNAFLHSDDEEDEEEEESQPLDQGGLATTGTTETENSTESGGQGFENMEGNDNALMSMSMEGSFYDDGGELLGGGDDRREAAQENHVYSEEAISEESYSQQDTYVEKQDSYSMNQYGFEQQQQQEQQQQIQNDFHPEQDTNAFGLTQDTFATTQNAFDPLSNATAPPAAAVNGVSDEGGNMGDLDSLLDAPVTEQGLQTPVTEKGGTVDSSVDSAGIDSIAREFESSVDFQPPQQPEVPKLDLDDAAPAKPEEPSSSVDEPPAPGAKEEVCQEAPAAAAAPDAGEAPAAAAAASGTTKASTTTTTVKKTSSAKAGGKTSTTTTTTKTTKETKTSNNRAAAARKTETTTTTTTSRTTPRKPGDSRPASAATSEKKPGSAKSATSPTKPTSAKPAGPLPSYAQPITPRKPREPKVPTPDEKKKLSTTPRLPSAGPKTPRPQSATTASSTTRSTTRTTTTGTTVGPSSRTAQLARPKSSPTKLTNGTPGGPSDTKSPTKKYGIDARNEGYKPGGGNVKITSEKKEYKATSRIDAGAKGATPGAAAPKPAPAKSSPRTPKTGEVKSKIGSMDNSTHSPGGGNVRIQSKKTDFSTVGSRIGSKDKMDHKPGGGNVKIENRKLKVEAKSKIGSLDNAKHTPSGGDKKIESRKLDFKDKASPKIGSLDKARTTSAGSEEGATEIPAANGATSDN